MSEMVTIPREVVERALKQYPFMGDDTLNALRAALAAGEAQPVGEVVDLDPDDENGACEAIVQLHQEVKVGDLLYAAPPQPAEEPK